MRSAILASTQPTRESSWTSATLSPAPVTAVRGKRFRSAS